MFIIIIIIRIHSNEAEIKIKNEWHPRAIKFSFYKQFSEMRKAEKFKDKKERTRLKIETNYKCYANKSAMKLWQTICF